MNRLSRVLCILIPSLTVHCHANADSKRIEVYELSQTYVDVVAGDTLGEIAASLLPHNVSLQQQLMQDIMSMNPSAFPDNRAERMLSGKRLFLPNSMQQADSKPGNQTYQVESYSWGNIKRPR